MPLLVNVLWLALCLANNLCDNVIPCLWCPSSGRKRANIKVPNRPNARPLPKNMKSNYAKKNIISQIQHFQRTTDLLITKLPFSRLVCMILGVCAFVCVCGGGGGVVFCVWPTCTSIPF